MIPLGPVVARARVRAPRETVWQYLVDPGKRSAWWPEVRLGSGLGGEVVERWSEGEGDDAVSRDASGDIDVWVEGHAVGFRWSEAGDEGSTAVLVTLRSQGVDTGVTVTETGFDSLPFPAERAAASLDGWQTLLADLVAAVDATLGADGLEALVLPGPVIGEAVSEADEAASDGEGDDTAADDAGDGDEGSGDAATPAADDGDEPADALRSETPPAEDDEDAVAEEDSAVDTDVDTEAEVGDTVEISASVIEAAREDEVPAAPSAEQSSDAADEAPEETAAGEPGEDDSHEEGEESENGEPRDAEDDDEDDSPTGDPDFDALIRGD